MYAQGYPQAIYHSTTFYKPLVILVAIFSGKVERLGH